MSAVAVRIGVLVAAVADLLAVVDLAFSPRGLPRDIPYLGWKATRDKYLYGEPYGYLGHSISVF